MDGKHSIKLAMAWGWVIIHITYEVEWGTKMTDWPHFSHFKVGEFLGFLINFRFREVDRHECLKHQHCYTLLRNRGITRGSDAMKSTSPCFFFRWPKGCVAGRLGFIGNLANVNGRSMVCWGFALGFAWLTMCPSVRCTEPKEVP